MHRERRDLNTDLSSQGPLTVLIVEYLTENGHLIVNYRISAWKKSILSDCEWYRLLQAGKPHCNASSIFYSTNFLSPLADGAWV